MPEHRHGISATISEIEAVKKSPGIRPEFTVPAEILPAYTPAAGTAVYKRRQCRRNSRQQRQRGRGGGSPPLNTTFGGQA